MKYTFLDGYIKYMEDGITEEYLEKISNVL